MVSCAVDHPPESNSRGIDEIVVRRALAVLERVDEVETVGERRLVAVTPVVMTLVGASVMTVGKRSNQVHDVTLYTRLTGYRQVAMLTETSNPMKCT